MKLRSLGNHAFCLGFNLEWAALVLVGVLVLALTAPPARAQVAPDAGSVLRQEQPPALELPSAPPPALRIDEPARPQLQVPSDVRFVLSGLRITGQTAFTESELLRLMPDLVGKEIGLTDLEQAASRVSRHYREQGYIVARAYLPAQEIRDGVVEIAVLEGRLGRIVVENRSRVRDSIVASRVAGLQGRLVRAADIDSRLRLIYDELAGIGPDASAALQPGANVGETDLVLQVEPGPLVTGSVELDNYGNRYTGGNRLSGQLHFHSPTGYGDLLSFQAIKGGAGLELYNASYQLPAGDDGLRIGADYTRVSYRLGRDFAPLQANGTADTWLAFASFPLALGSTYSVRARISYQQSNTQDRIDAAATVTDRSSHFSTLAIVGDWRDRFVGGGRSALSLSYGVGLLDIESPIARAIDFSSARTEGSFQKWNLSVMRLQQLTARTSLYLFYTAQKAGTNLDSSEKMILGGADGVKAYPRGEAPGDSGYLINAELRYAPSEPWLSSRTELLAFVDTGRVVVNENQFAPGPNRRRLSSLGLGLNWNGPHDFFLRLLIAHKLGDAPATSDTDDSTRGWLQIIKRF